MNVTQDTGHPREILCAPDLATGCRIGYDMATAYRELLQAALEQLHRMTVQHDELRTRLREVIAENRALRAPLQQDARRAA